ncbi:MAG: hypoxanthine phosphoribosyltransferase [Myxococcales bacterium]|nr:hypoxanthine phosphoribosyltransferase [Myxococcales bacterium]MCB1007989.1 hypoxanthine phosphoribosyltransferase [Acidobacteriota bacterium]
MGEEKPSHTVRPLIRAEEIARRVDELAAEIDRDYADSRSLVVVGVLKGSVFFFTDLVRRLSTPPVRVDFFQTSSYGAGTTAGEVRIKRDIDLSVRGRDVLLVEDIVDTGWTLRTILDLFRFRGAASVKLCALLDKHEAREVDVPIDYCGFRIGREFVVGYGLDYDEQYRNLPYVGVVEFQEEENR